MKLVLVVSLGVALVASCPFGDEEIKAGKRLIKTSFEEPGQWMDEDEIWALIMKHQNFIDITDHNFPDIKEGDVNVQAIPTTLRFQSTVNGLLGRTNITRIQDFVGTFSSYFSRYYQSPNGTESQRWLLSQVQDSIANYVGNATVNEVVHPFGVQNSIIARITGSDPTLRGEIVIIGAHQDSVNTFGALLAAPGADDNASGSVVVLETLRVLVEGGYIPKRTIEFHWYAAEEVGLRGSAAIAQIYNTNRVNVVGMVNFDVPGYHIAGRDEIGIYTDHVNAEVTTLLRLLVDGYCTYTWINKTCGYGCSDHASWTNYGFPAGFPAETVFHPLMHRPGDNFESVGFTQVNEFVKLSLGFVVEMSEPGSL
ncbi:leucine aminopeptidase 1 [Folsomia candida]|uniref:leucine aminopeptidase 1 n=1 Tax=Folsomia candida TaxID=158441 RepID=UPI000B8F29A4|nr:leucine aminopeptidase 1 [Folsomia candida]